MREREKYEDLLSAYMDGHTTDEENSELMAHLDSCSDCADILAACSALSSAVSADCDPPEALLTGVMERVHTINSERAAQKKKVFIKNVWRYSAVAACLALVIFAAARFRPLSKADNAKANIMTASSDIGFKSAVTPFSDSGTSGEAAHDAVTENVQSGGAVNEAEYSADTFKMKSDASDDITVKSDASPYGAMVNGLSGSTLPPVSEEDYFASVVTETLPVELTDYETVTLSNGSVAVVVEKELFNKLVSAESLDALYFNADSEFALIIVEELQ